MQPNRAKILSIKWENFLGDGKLWWQPLNWMEIKINAVHSVNIGMTQQISISDHKTQSTEFGSLKLLQNVFAWSGTCKRVLVCVARNLRINWDNWGIHGGIIRKWLEEQDITCSSFLHMKMWNIAADFLICFCRYDIIKVREIQERTRGETHEPLL